jgi:glycosyltransferase involved in cell wall biosynthesis
MDAYSRQKDLPFLVLIGQNHDLDHGLSERILNTPNVRLLGFARKEFLHSLYSKAMLFVFPSRYEGFGYPPLEAMACGCPVLSSDAPAMKEILGNAAEFFASGNVEDLLCRLVQMCADETKRRNRTSMGREQASKFCTEESLKKLQEIWA